MITGKYSPCAVRVKQRQQVDLEVRSFHVQPTKPTELDFDDLWKVMWGHLWHRRVDRVRRPHVHVWSCRVNLRTTRTFGETLAARVRRATAPWQHASDFEEDGAEAGTAETQTPNPLNSAASGADLKVAKNKARANEGAVNDGAEPVQVPVRVIIHSATDQEGAPVVWHLEAGPLEQSATIHDLAARVFEQLGAPSPALRWRPVSVGKALAWAQLEGGDSEKGLRVVLARTGAAIPLSSRVCDSYAPGTGAEDEPAVVWIVEQQVK